MFKVQGSKFNVRFGAASLSIAVLMAISSAFVRAAEERLAPIKIAYATTSGIRLPLWIAEEAKLYLKVWSRRQTDQYTLW